MQILLIDSSEMYPINCITVIKWLFNEGMETEKEYFRDKRINKKVSHETVRLRIFHKSLDCNSISFNDNHREFEKRRDIIAVS